MKFIYLFVLLAIVTVLPSCNINQQDVESTASTIVEATPVDYEIPNGLNWRFIGPMAGARGSVVLGHPTQRNVFYHGASNGLWKTEDAGLYWIPVGDKYFKSGNIGAMEISPSDPNVMYVGMGEPQMRNNVSWGDGVYKSTDGGNSWTHLGLEETHHISQVRIHPENPDIVYVGAFGHAFGPNPERGVYRTTDGGQNWEKILFKSDKSGVIDLVLNPSDPDVLFASMWEFERKAWGPTTGGPESGIWKSTDGGDTWNEITFNNGLPEGGRGRTGLTMSAADGNRVYALIDSETKPGLYRSDDLGENWRFVSDFFQIIGRPFYYSHIYANPSDADDLWSPNNRLFHSEDGGENWILEPGIKDDFHDIWIDNNDPMRMIVTNDGGCQVSLNGGLSWSTQWTQKNVQLYRVDTDNEFPYNVYTVGQDVLAYKIPSASRWGGISGYEATIVGNGETSNAIPNPSDPNIVYSISGGSSYGSGAPFTKNNLATGQNEYRNVYPIAMFGLNASDLKYRFNWDTPFFVSPHDSKTIYLGANVVMRTRDEGLTWEVISEDLTNNIQERQKITGTPWLSEYFGQEIYSTIHRMAESPIRKGVIWTGSDDGKIYVTKNGGNTWEDVSINEGIPQYSQVYEVEPSPHDPATAYVAFSNFNTDDDYRPYIFKTSDFGKSWTNLSGNFPENELTRTIREDTKQPGLLFAGSETGFFYSPDDGQSWNSLRLNMPAVPVVDIKVKDNDLVIATNGRGIWIMDDITPLREYSETIDKKPVHLYAIPDYTRFGYNWWMDYLPGGDPGDKKNYFVQNMRQGLTYYELGFKPVNGERKRKFIDAGDPKPLGVSMYFKLNSEPEAINLEILDAGGNVIRSYTKEEMMLNTGVGDPNAGLNTFTWDMRITQVTPIPGRPPTAIRPIVPPGRYQARLTADGVSETQSFSIQMNPKETYTNAQARTKFAFWMDLHNTAETQTQKVINALEIKKEVEEALAAYLEGNATAEEKKAMEENARPVLELIDSYEGAYVSTGRTLAEIINLPATILSKMAFLSGMLEHSEGPVTKQMKEVLLQLKAESATADADFDNKIQELKRTFDTAMGN